MLAETPETNGITRLFSKVVLKGTKTRTAEQIADQIEAVGGSIGSDAGNNSIAVSVKITRPDLKLGSRYSFRCADKRHHARESHLARKGNPTCGHQGRGGGDDDRCRNLMRASLFPNHPFGLRASGTPESVGSLSQKALLDFQNNYITGQQRSDRGVRQCEGRRSEGLVEKYMRQTSRRGPSLRTCRSRSRWKKR